MMNERSVIELIYQAKENGIDVLLNEGQLQLKLPKNKGFDKNLIEEIKANKELILDFLQKNERGGKTNYKINKIDRNTVTRLPLSFTQERLWFVDQLEGTIPYHLPSILRLSGKLDMQALGFALKSVVDRHEVLRTIILSDEGTGYQQVRNADGWQLNIKDAATYLNDEKGLRQQIEELIKAPFDLSKDYMLRADLLSLSQDNYVLVSTMHHIASDGWSSSVLVREIIEFYESYVENRPARLEGLPIQYADYAAWQRNYLAGDLLDKKISYWKQKLAGISSIELPVDFVRPPVQSTKGAVISFGVDKELSFQLQELSQRQGVTLFMTLLAAIKVLLYRYTGQQDICVGTGLAGRQHKELEGLIGFFVNMLALRSEVNPQLPFTQLLQNLKATTLEAYEHQDLPFEKVVNAIVEERDTSISPLFQVLFEMQNNPEIPELRLGEVELTSEPFEQGISKFDITFFLKPTAEGLQGSIQYSTALFRTETILRMIAHYKELLSSIIKKPDQRIAKLQMLSNEEERQLLEEFNKPAAEVKTGSNITAIIETQVAKTPENTALIFKQKQLTYRELNERSNQLAHLLKTKGVGAGVLVPLLIERSLDMVVAILAILKAGGAYVPVDPEYPFERIIYLLNDIGSAIVVTNNDSYAKLQQTDEFEIIVTDDEWSAIDLQPKANLKEVISSGDLAYVIYTSGSTGQPKGVMIEHGALLNYLLNNKTKYLSDNEQGAGTFLHLSYTFDASITGLFMPLLAGKSVVLGSKQSVEVFEDENLLKWAPYDFIKLTPSHLPLLERVFKTNNSLTGRLVIGGEALRVSQFDYLIKQQINVEIVNEYGPTEATVGCSTYRFQTITDKEKLQESAGISIGKPIDNVTLYIFDNENNLLPVGIPGEIFIGGAGLAKGYLNREELTKQKFVANPFNKEGEARLYKTGDIGKWLADGNIEYIGRRDDQVKIRGYRIELGEIEACLSSIEGVKDAKVLVSENGIVNSKILNAYIQVDKEKLPELNEHLYRLNNTNEAKAESTAPQEFVKVIRANIEERLPAYMLPANIILLDQFPMTINGKIDKKALPKTEVGAGAIESESDLAEETETEKALIDIWKDLLGLETVGVHDNFFNLGGDSIITIQLVSRARSAGYELAVADVFTHQTISKLARHIEQTNNLLLKVTGEQGELTGPAGLLPIQQWYFENASANVSHFNQSVLLGIDKQVTTTVLQSAIDLLTSHHDALRFIYTKQEGSWQQQYGIYKGRVITEDLREVPEQQLMALITEKATAHQKSLRIEKGELIRVVWMETASSEKNNRLFIVVHHLAIDGVSWRILLEDLERVLTAAINKEKNVLSTKTSSYRQWYMALNGYGLSGSMLQQKNYWMQNSAVKHPLPVDKQFDGEIKIKDICSTVVRLEAEKTRQLLQEVPRVFHTEVNDILLSALARTLCEWNNTDEVVIGLEGHGRQQVEEGIDTSRTVGWFTTLFPVLLTGSKNKKAGDLIKTIKEQLRLVPDKGIGYGVLKYINKEQNLQGKDPWEVVFNYMGQLENTARKDKLLSIAEGFTGQGINDEHIVNEKLGINSSVRSGELVLNWTYSTKFYYEETINRLSSAYLSNLEGLIEHALQQGKLNEVFTPADFGLSSDIGYEELDAFLDEDEKDNIMSF